MKQTHIFFFNPTPTSEIYTLSLHDALPISCRRCICREASTTIARHHPLCASGRNRSEEHTSELQSLTNLVCRLLLEKKNQTKTRGRGRKRCEHFPFPKVFIVFALTKKPTSG